MSYYLAKDASASIPTSIAFTQRSIPQMTTGPVSDSSILIAPTRRQIAYDGYKANIDAFVHATAHKSTVSTAAVFLGIPEDYTASFPLPTPNVSFEFVKPLPADKEAVFMERMAKYNVQKHQRGKAYVFTLDRPPLSLIIGSIARLSKDGVPPLAGYVTPMGFVASYKLYQLVDLFLRVNTYPFCPSESSGSHKEGQVTLTGLEIMITSKRNEVWEELNEQFERIKRQKLDEANKGKEGEDILMEIDVNEETIEEEELELSGAN
jgi:hypothetical protein